MTVAMRAKVRAILRRSARRMLLARVLESAALGATAGGVIAAAGMLCRSLWPTTVWVSIPLWYFPVVLLGGGALAGAALAGMRAVRPREAAVFLDLRYGLKEQLGTAAEMDRAGLDDAVARCVYSRAEAALARLGRVSFWRRTRKTPAALMGAVMLCGAMLLLFPSQLGRGEADEIIGKLEAMSPARRAALVEAFRRSAGRAADHAERENLIAVAKAIEVKDDRALKELIEAMERTGTKLTLAKIILRRELGTFDSELELVSESVASGGSFAERQATSRHAGKAGEETGYWVGVYDPAYARGVRKSENALPGGVIKAPWMLKADEAWSVARSRAASAVAGGEVPPAYRPIVRAFFDNPPAH